MTSIDFDKIKAEWRSWQAAVTRLVQRDSDHSLVGIDIGASSVKVVQAAYVDGELTVEKAMLVDIKGDPKKEEEVLATLRMALVGIETEGARVNAVVNCPQTCTRRIVAPRMPRKELDQAVRWEASNAIPFALDDALMDYEVVEEISEKNSKKLIIAVAATPKETVENLLKVLKKADVEVSAVVPVPLAFQNALNLSADWKQGTLAVVEMGAALTELNIYNDGRLVFSRKLPIAGNDITKALTSTLMSSQGKTELSLEEAEKIKREKGVPGDDETESVDGKILPIQILSLVRPCLEQLAGEMERSFDFYREESHGNRIDKILLFGGGACLKGCADFLKKELNMEVEVGNTFEGIRLMPGAAGDDGNNVSRFNLALGAALHQAKQINVLPLELKEKTKRFVENVSWKGLLAGIIAALALFYAGLHIRLASYNKKRAALELERRILNPQLEGLRESISIGALIKDEPYWEDVLRELSHLVPAQVQLTGIKAEGATVRLSGEIFKSDQDPQAVLSRFMLVLEEGLFRNVNLVKTQNKPGNADIVDFELICAVE